MRNYLNEYNDLYINILKEFDKYQDISFEYDDDTIYDLPRVFSVNKYNQYEEFAVVHIKDCGIIAVSIDNLNEDRIFYFDDLTLPQLIELLEYTNEYIKQLN